MSNLERRPIAWLWQNGLVLQDGCFQFFPTADRADREISFCGGWKTPIFEDGSMFDNEAADVFKGLYLFEHFEGFDQELSVSSVRAKAIVVYMAKEARP